MAAFAAIGHDFFFLTFTDIYIHKYLTAANSRRFSIYTPYDTTFWWCEM